MPLNVYIGADQKQVEQVISQNFIQKLLFIHPIGNTLEIYTGFPLYERSSKEFLCPEDFQRVEDQPLDLLYAQAHQLATQYPGEEIELVFNSKDEELLSRAYYYFKNYPVALPANVSLICDRFYPIRGKGSVGENLVLPVSAEEVKIKNNKNLIDIDYLDKVYTKLDKLQRLIEENPHNLANDLLEPMQQIHKVIQDGLGPRSLDLQAKFDKICKANPPKFGRIWGVHKAIKDSIDFINRDPTFDSFIALRNEILLINDSYGILPHKIKPLLTSITNTGFKSPWKIHCIDLSINLEQALNFSRAGIKGKIKVYTDAGDVLYRQVKNRLSSNNISEAEYEYIAAALINATNLINSPMNIEKERAFKQFSSTKIGFFDKAFSDSKQLENLFKGFLCMLVGIGTCLLYPKEADFIFNMGQKLVENAAEALGLTITPAEKAISDILEHLGEEVASNCPVKKLNL